MKLKDILELHCIGKHCYSKIKHTTGNWYTGITGNQQSRCIKIYVNWEAKLIGKFSLTEQWTSIIRTVLQPNNLKELQQVKH